MMEKIAKILGKANHKALELIIKNTQDLIFILNSEFQFIFINSKPFQTWLGYEKTEILKKPIFQFLHKKDKKTLTKKLNKLEAGAESGGEFRLEHRSKSFKKYDYSVKSIKDEQQNHLFLFISHIKKSLENQTKKVSNAEQRFREMIDNLTEIRFWKLLQPREYKEALQESEDILKVIMDNIPQYIAWKDKNLIYLGCNNNYAGIAGVENPMNIIGKTDFELVWGQEEAEYLYISDKSVIESNQPEYHTIESWYREDGKIVWFDTNRIPLRDSNENVVGILITFENITERRKAEEEIRNRERRFRNLIETMNEGLGIFDKQQRITYVNDRLCEILGYDRDELINHLVYNFVDEENKILIREQIQKRKLGYADTYEMTWKKKNGSNAYTIVSPQPVFDINNEFVGSFAVITDITELKRTNKKLEESEKKYRELTEFLPETIYELDLNNRITYVNSAGLKQFKLTQDDLEKGLYVSDFFPKKQYKRASKNLKTTLKHGLIRPNEYIMKRWDGTQFHARILSKRILEDGKPIGLRGVVHDITESKIAEHKITESEEKYRLISENANDIILIIGKNFKIEYINEKPVYKILGYTKEEILGNRPREFISSEYYKNGVFPLIEKLRKGDKIIEAKIKKKDGGFINVEINASAFTDKNNVTKFLVIARDITERKVAERLLQESEKKYRHLFNSSPYAIWLVDMKGKIVDCNITMNRFLSVFSREDLIGRDFREVLKLFLRRGDARFEELIPVFAERFRALVKNKKLEPYEFQIARGDGKEFWLTLEGSFVHFENKTLLQVFIMDITERKLAELKIRESEEKLKELNKELEQKVMERTRQLMEKNIELQKLDRLKDEFITAAAHELKTPLISISGYTDYILTKYKETLNPEIKKDLVIVQRNIERLQKLMNQILDVMKIEAKKMELNREQTNMREIITNCISELSYLFKNKDQEVVVNVDYNLSLNIDPERMFQVFSNLLSNANKYTLPGGKIEINSEKINNKYLFIVEDNGIGLKPSELKRLFKKFEMIKHNSSNEYIKGTGLGLYITKGFVEAHGGKIWATSDGLEKGTSFYFTVPLDLNKS
ncbi:MAG: PAS domain S-box protein [Candidatus Lokiarchaeota archaeon]|nr:PAS domain S-box protein [Candidatus Lokiarchaeota archaeon]